MAGRNELRSFDRVADIYDATRGFPEGVEAQVGCELAALLPRKDARVAEVGVGTGRVAVPLAAQGTRVVGLDISRKMLERLVAKGAGVDVLLAEGAHPPFRRATFDAVLFVHILHLVPDAPATVRAAMELLRPGGRLLACATSYTESPVQLAAKAMRRITAEVAGREVQEWNSNARWQAAVRQVADEAGARVREVEVARWRERLTAGQMVDELARKVHSQTWAIPDELLPAVVERARRELTELCGGLDTVHENEAIFSALVVEHG